MEATRFLKQHKTQVQDILTGNIQYAIDRVFEAKLVVRFEHTNLKSIPDPLNAATVLVDKILYRGETTIRTFLHLLQDRKLTEEFPDLKNLPWNTLNSPPAPPSIDPPPRSTEPPTRSIDPPTRSIVPPARSIAPPPRRDTARITSPVQVSKKVKVDDEGSHFVDRHRCSLVQRVSTVAPILDLLYSEGVLTGESYSIVRSKNTNADMMRELYKFLGSRGPRAKDIFYRGLQENERYLLEDLRQQVTTADRGASGSRETTCGDRAPTSGYRATAVNTFSKVSVAPTVVVEDAANEYRLMFRAAGLFQCRQTAVGFKTTAEGEVIYRIVQWDERQLQSTRRTPAGPLYSIQCAQETVCQLHLPHCDTTPGDLSVAHITDEGLRLLQPLEVTRTHAIVNATHLSFYGLLKRAEAQSSPTRGQVLLFLRPPGRRKQMLNVMLLPGNLPAKEVKVLHEDDEHIETMSDCNNLTPNQVYSLRCTSYHVQPQAATYRLNYGPNYHPTFQVTFDLNADEFTLELLGPGNDLVWKQDIDLGAQPQVAAAPVPATPQRPAASVPSQRSSASHFVDQHRVSLINRVTMVDSILDLLLSERGITQHGYDQVRSKATSMAKMRELYALLNSGGPRAKDLFYRGLQRNEPMLLEDLNH